MHSLRRLFFPLSLAGALVVTAMVASPSVAHGSSRSQGPHQYVFGHDTVVDMPVHGDVQVYGGSAVVRAAVDGDLLVFGDSITFEKNGRVAGDVIFAGRNINNADGRIGGQIYTTSTLQGAAAMVSRTAVTLALLFVWMIVAVVLALVSGREVRFSSAEVRLSPLHCFALGLVALTSFVLSAIVFSYLVPYLVGIPLIVALAVLAVLTKIYGMIAVFHAIGSVVAGARTHEQLARRKWLRGDLAMVVAGVLILGAIRLIPVVGTIVWACASVFGIGVALATKFGRREPWFLAWRPAET